MRNALFILLFVTLKSFAANPSNGKGSNVLRIHYLQNKSNREDLSKFIRYLNDIETSDGNLGNEKEKDSNKIEDLMKILQRNYDIATKLRIRKQIPAARLYIVRNPEVLEEYQRNLRNKDDSSNLDDSNDEDNNGLDPSVNIRREAGLRHNTGKRNFNKNHNLNIKLSRDRYSSAENRDVTPFKVLTINENLKEPKVENVYNKIENKRFRQKHKDDNERSKPRQNRNDNNNWKDKTAREYSKEEFRDTGKNRYSESESRNNYNAELIQSNGYNRNIPKIHKPNKQLAKSNVWKNNGKNWQGYNKKHDGDNKRITNNYKLPQKKTKNNIYYKHGEDIFRGRTPIPLLRKKVVYDD